MTQAEKARIYEDCIRENDRLKREISKIKSQYPINVPAEQQRIIDMTLRKINELEQKVKKLFT